MRRGDRRRYSSRPSITVVARQRRRGSLRRAWLKPRVPPEPLRRKWEGGEESSRCPISLPPPPSPPLFMRCLHQRLLLHVSSPLPAFYSGRWWTCVHVPHISLWVWMIAGAPHRSGNITLCILRGGGTQNALNNRITESGVWLIWRGPSAEVIYGRRSAVGGRLNQQRKSRFGKGPKVQSGKVQKMLKTF